MSQNSTSFEQLQVLRTLGVLAYGVTQRDPGK